MEKMKKILWGGIAFALTYPAVSFACDGPPPEPPCSPPIKLDNPLASSDIYAFIQSILEIVFRLGTVVAIFFIIYSGFLFITAQGDPPKLQTARKAFLWTVVGTAILLGSWVLATAIKGTIDQLKKKPSQATIRMFADAETVGRVRF